jgi:hypothetical protein
MPYALDPPPPDLDDLEEDLESLTHVHIYSSDEIREMVDTGWDIPDAPDAPGEPTAPATWPGDAPAPSASSEATTVPPASTQEYDALLMETYLAALGGTEGCPVLAVEPRRVLTLPLGPQAAFVLSRIDGQSSVEDVLDMSSFPRVETLRILYDLLQQGIIEVGAFGT